MERPTRRTLPGNLILVLAALASAVAGSLLGAWWPVLLLIAVSLLVILHQHQPRPIQVSMLLTALAGYIATSSVVTALVLVGADPAYQSRIFCGWVALGCAAAISCPCPLS
jgi:hypothetical protein